MTVSPGGPPGDDPHGHVLASDAEREATVERLRVALADGRLTMDELSDRSEIAYRARTTAELAALTRDLPQPGSAVPAGGPVVMQSAEERTDSYVAVFSGAERKGRWRVPRRSRAVAVFGGIELDLREAELSAHDTYLNVVAVFSGVAIYVPEGVDVHLTGMAIFGAKAANVPPAPPGAPVLHIHCTAVFAGVEVKLKAPPAQGIAAVRNALAPPRRPGPPPSPPPAP